MDTNINIWGLIACQESDLIKCFTWHLKKSDIDQRTADEVQDPQVRSAWIRLGPKRNDNCPYKSSRGIWYGHRGDDHLKMETEAIHKPREAENGQLPPETRRETQNRGSRKNEPCWHLEFILLASRTVSEYTSVVSSHSICSRSLWRPWQLAQHCLQNSENIVTGQFPCAGLWAGSGWPLSLHSQLNVCDIELVLNKCSLTWTGQSKFLCNEYLKESVSWTQTLPSNKWNGLLAWASGRHEIWWVN